MAKTNLTFDKEVREKLLKGVNLMADAVGSTLGPRGRNVAIARTAPNGQIYERIVVHDGVTVARSIDLPDEMENMGAQLLKQASQKQVDAVGDGTTVVMILAQAIINECLALVASGVNPMSLRKGLEDAIKQLQNELLHLALPIKGVDDMKYIATISAEDEELGSLVAETLKKIGKDGVVTVEESKSSETTVEHQEGMQLDRGYLHPWLVTNPERMEAVIENAYMLITDKPITTLTELGPFLLEFIKVSKQLVIISPDISGEALPLFVQNKIDGKLFTLCIQAPSFGKDQKSILQDIAILTGAKFISEDAGHNFRDLIMKDLGFAEYVTSTKEETIIVGGRGKKEDVAVRVASIKKEIETEDSEFDKERLKARLGRLTSGVAVVRVGGHTEVEMKERRERVLDAIAATRAAMDKGIVPGGEIVFLRIREILGKKEKSVTDKIMYQALYKPFLKLITNADISEVDVAMALHGKGKQFGVDVVDGQVKDMIAARIVDPVLVPFHALQNAVSVAIQVMTTGTIITPVPPKEK